MQNYKKNNEIAKILKDFFNKIATIFTNNCNQIEDKNVLFT